MSIVACAVLGGSAAIASAQDKVNVYGVLDAGVVRERGCEGDCSTRISSGVASESRIGITGSEAITNNTSAVFTLESGIELDTGRAGQGERVFGSQAWVGLAGPLGTLTFGRHYNLEYLALAEVGDPFRAGMAGAATNLVGTGGKRIDNSLVYRAERNGLLAGASYAFDESDIDSSQAGRAWGMTVGIKLGALTLRAAHQNRNVAKVQRINPIDITMAARNSIIAANLRLGWGTAYAAYSASRGWNSSPLFNPDNPYGAGMATTHSTDSRDVLVGVAIPFNHATTLLASYIKKNDRDPANRDAEQWAVGATYAVSRRLDFYAAYSHIRNRNGAAYTAGNASSRGNGTSALNVGMRHAF
jgi:predicted porin